MFLYQQIFFSTIAVSFGILHLIIFLYNRRFKSNLFFAIFLFLYALNIFFDYQTSLSGQTAEGLTYLRLHRAVMPYNSVFALLFLYYAFDFNIPKYFWLIAAALAVTGFFAVLDPINNFDYVQIPLIIVSLEAFRILTSAIMKKKYDAWIIATGFFLLFLFSSYDLFMDLGLINPVAGIVNGYPFGFLCLIIFASIYLARDFARANKTILIKEREAKKMEIAQRVLEVEDNRKAKELNEARELQLSLLPQCITNLKNYDFCFDMRPATEVGGDYYDYNISESGEISIVIGDATDHGMKAGMMVSIIKSLFLTHINNMGIREFLNSCSHTIKQMKLKNLYMALMLVKLNDHRLTMSSAGIPPLLIYRLETNMVEEYKIKGMPLGAVESYPYETIDIELETGDTVILMTDGLPELFNKDKESFGDERIKEIFLQNAGEPVNEIVSKLFLAGEEWMKGCKQNDDITLVAFRVKV
ncbi:MAG: SpoIIE family protein phosphatase [Ignavibacteriaceae bacterium]|nr:SpoIIE family protein phosphatase [Ignavibacteriaceae bacterium]MCW8812988.1 SpoIIE family protein phosphatase [Chlorobium sp.]MCW8817500.1 SpoIIE family protein phosphatase [Ignavibacteriaceae bacterium]MCW9094616.1 SpoIIE family protein phosphatase [Ignavibacteriaceae bacterium]